MAPVKPMTLPPTPVPPVTPGTPGTTTTTTTTEVTPTPAKDEVTLSDRLRAKPVKVIVDGE